MGHYEILVHETAKADIRGIVGYIARDLREPNTARAMSRRLQDAILSLGSMPERFPLVSDKYLSSFLRCQPKRTPSGYIPCIVWKKGLEQNYN